MKTGLVPAEPIWNVVNDWMRLNDMNQQNLADAVGTSARNLFRFLNREQKSMSWELADTIITRTVGPLYWHTHPELRDIYWSTDLNRLDLIKPLENETAMEWATTTLIEAWDSSRTKRDAAKKLGMDVGTFARRLDEALISVGRESVMGYYASGQFA